MTAIHITRKRGAYGAMRSLTLLAKYGTGETQALARIRAGETVTLNVPEDAVAIFGKMDWGRTVNSIPATQIVAGARFELRLWFTLNPLKMLGLPSIPARFVPQD